MSFIYRGGLNEISPTDSSILILGAQLVALRRLRACAFVGGSASLEAGS